LARVVPGEPVDGMYELYLSGVDRNPGFLFGFAYDAGCCQPIAI